MDDIARWSTDFNEEDDADEEDADETQNRRLLPRGFPRRVAG